MVQKDEIQNIFLKQNPIEVEVKYKYNIYEINLNFFFSVKFML